MNQICKKESITTCAFSSKDTKQNAHTLKADWILTMCPCDVTVYFLSLSSSFERIAFGGIRLIRDDRV